MLNSESCELGRQALQRLDGARAESLGNALRNAGEQSPRRQVPKGVCRDFAAVMYGILVKEMQRSVRAFGDEGESPYARGAEDMVGMYLPRAMASKADDPVVRYFREGLSMDYGERLDEEA